MKRMLLLCIVLCSSLGLVAQVSKQSIYQNENNPISQGVKLSQWGRIEIPKKEVSRQNLPQERGDTLRLQKALSFCRKGDFKAAYLVLEKASAEAPEQIKEVELRGILGCFYLQKAESAHADFKAIRSRQSQNDTLWYYSACASYGVDSLQQAIAELTQSLEINPRFLPARFLRMGLYGQAQNWQGVFSDCEYLLQHETLLVDQSSAVWNEEAIALLELQQEEMALLAINKALREAPAEALFWETRAQIYASLGQTAEAISDCTRSLELHPSQRCYRLRNKLYLLKGDSLAAKSDQLSAENCTDKIPPSLRWLPIP